MKKGPPPEEKGESAPLWIISFADMISLLMAFFVMLLTMATPKSGMLCMDKDVFYKTISSFNSAISDFGIPWLINLGGEMVPNDNYRGNPPNLDEKSPLPEAVDGRQNETEMLFSNLHKQAKTFRSPTEDRYPEFIIGPVMFEKGQISLNSEGKKYLTELTSQLAESANQKPAILYVVGLANEETDENKKWLISAKRAHAVSNFMQNNLPDGQVTIYAWGAASGGHWTGQEGFVSDQSQVLIAVLHEGE